MSENVINEKENVVFQMEALCELYNWIMVSKYGNHVKADSKFFHNLHMYENNVHEIWFHVLTKNFEYSVEYDMSTDMYKTGNPQKNDMSEISGEAYKSLTAAIKDVCEKYNYKYDNKTLFRFIF